MRHSVAILCVLLLPLLYHSGHSRAQTNDFGVCAITPLTTFIPCTPTPPVPNPPITPTKELNVSGGAPGPYNTTSYGVTITSRFACFTLDEPIDVLTLGNPHAAALTALSPSLQATGGSHAAVSVSEDTGTADLLLEVFNAVVGPEGLVLKALWPKEIIERLRIIVPPATPVIPATVTPTETPQTSPTVTPASVATAAAGPLTIRVCTTPRVMRGASLGGTAATLYAQTSPGAECSADVFYDTGASAESFPTDLIETANSQGLVYWSWREDSEGTLGTGLVVCTSGTQTVSGTVDFPIVQAGLSPGTPERQRHTLAATLFRSM